MSIRKTDIDGNGQSEILFSDRKGSRSGIFLLQHLDSPPWFDPPELIGAAGDEVMFLDVADLNSDNKPDIAAAIRPDKISYFYQPEDSTDSKWERREQFAGVPGERFGSSKAVAIADINRDGRLDAVITCERADGKLSGVFWVTMRTASSERGLHYRDISGPDGVKYDRMELLDIDKDGDLDIMTCEERSNLGVFWYENPTIP